MISTGERYPNIILLQPGDNLTRNVANNARNIIQIHENGTFEVLKVYDPSAFKLKNGFIKSILNKRK